MAVARIIPSKPAMIIEGEKRHLILADLHLGFEGILDARRVSVGKYTTTDGTIAEVSGLVNRVRPDTLVLLGDIRSGTGSISRSEWNEIPHFFDEICRIVEVIAIPGNHDANIQELIPEEATSTGPGGIILENILLTHGHAMPSENFAHVDDIVMGHLHPVFLDEQSVLSGQRVWIVATAPKQEIFPSWSGTVRITVVPAFNRYLYASHRIRHARSISPIIERIRGSSTARIITLDGAIIGDGIILDDVI